MGIMAVTIELAPLLQGKVQRQASAGAAGFESPAGHRLQQVQLGSATPCPSNPCLGRHAPDAASSLSALLAGPALLI